MLSIKNLILAAAVFAAPCLHAALPTVGVYAEGDANTVDFTMGYSGNTTWTTGIGQELGASQILAYDYFVAQVATAFAAGRGGVINFDGVDPAAYNQIQSFTASFANGEKSLTFENNLGGNYSIGGPQGDRTAVSGQQFLATGGNPHFGFNITGAGFAPDERVVAIGVTVLGRNGQGTGRNYRIIAYYTNGVDTGSSSTFRTFDMQNGNGTHDSFSGIVAPQGYWITALRMQSDQGIYTSIDDIAFITETLSPYLDFEVPFAINFGEGSGRQGDAGLVVSNEESFTLESNSLILQAISTSFAPAAALANVVNHRDREDFSLETRILVREAPQEPGHRVGLALLGGPDPSSFDAQENDSFYGLVWTPGDTASSVIEIREGFNGTVLASAPWTGGAPVAGELVTVFFEDFEDSMSVWTSGGAENLWEIGPLVFGHGPSSAYSGQNVAATGLDENYRHNTNAWLRSPVIDLSSALEAELRFWEFSDVDDWGDAEAHYTRISIRDAVTNTELVELDRFNYHGNDWQNRAYQIPSKALGRAVVVEFRLVSDHIDGDMHAGWFIDDVEVLAAQAPVYHLAGEGFYLPDGSLTLGFNLMDEEGSAQKVSANIADPISGGLFGIGGYSRIENGTAPAFGFMDLSMDVAPYSFAFGADPDRDSGDRFIKNVPGDWTVMPDALRLTTNAATYQNSVAVNHIPYFEPSAYRMLELKMSVQSLDAGESGNRVGLVLFGDDDTAVFDAADDSTYYTFQWIPNTSAGGMVAVRKGMDGAIVAQVDFADLKNPPVLTMGGEYTFTILKNYPTNGGMNFWASLTDGHGGEAAVSGSLAEVPGGTRFGFGARHRAAENPVWNFHEFNWLEDLPLPMPLDYRFGNAEARDAPTGFVTDPVAPGTWSLLGNSWRVNRDDATTRAGEVRSSASVDAFYTPGQDFAVRGVVSTRLLPEAETVLSLASGGDPQNQIEVGSSGATHERGTVAVSFSLRRETGGTLFGHVAPRNNFSNRIYITYHNPERGISVRLGSSSEVDVGFVPALGEWHHIALAWDDGEFWVYLDGEEIATGAYEGLNQLSDVFEIGNIGHIDRNEYAPNAFLREASAWNIALTESEVQAAIAGLTGNETGLVGYWPLNEGEGTVATDLSPNGNHGLITGAEWLNAAPRFGLSFLGRDTDADSAFTFEWLPVSQELRIVPPADLQNGAGAAVLDLSGVAGAPQFEAGMPYLLEVRGIHQPDGSLELVGLLMDGDEAEVELSSTMANAASYPQGTRFGIVGRHVSLDWRVFQLGTPAQLDLLDPTDPQGATFEAWQAQHFMEDELNDVEISGRLATPVGDGLANLLKYAFGLEPKVAVASNDPRLPQVAMTESGLELTYRELVDALDLEYIPEMSGALNGWNSESVEEVGRVPAGEFEEVTVRAILPEGAPRGFLRVRVVANDL